MTADEIAAEVKSDFKDIVQKSDFKQHKVDKLIQKASVYPVYVHTELVSKKKNKWLVLWEAKSKKNVGDKSLVTFICFYELHNGRYAVMPSFFQGKMTYLIFVPHFFARYALRYNIELKGIDLIRRFFKHNSSFAFTYKNQIIEENKYRVHVYGKSSEGAALGLKLNTKEDMILFKTFISEAMFRGQQIADFAEKEDIRKEYDIETTSIE